MTQKEKLTELIAKSVKEFSCEACTPTEEKCSVCIPEKQADYLLSKGVIALPCKIGDNAWCIRNNKNRKTLHQGFVSEMYFNDKMELAAVVKHVARGLIGKTVFLTQEDAEKAIQEGKQ